MGRAGRLHHRGSTWGSAMAHGREAHAVHSCSCGGEAAQRLPLLELACHAPRPPSPLRPSRPMWRSGCACMSRPSSGCVGGWSDFADVVSSGCRPEGEGEAAAHGRPHRHCPQRVAKGQLGRLWLRWHKGGCRGAGCPQAAHVLLLPPPRSSPGSPPADGPADRPCAEGHAGAPHGGAAHRGTTGGLGEGEWKGADRKPDS
jgi:hypothetical protein